MKIRVGDLQRIIREELEASRRPAGTLNEAGDVAAWYSRQLKVPPALQAACLNTVGSGISLAERQLRSMVTRAKEVGSSVPPEVQSLLDHMDGLLDLHVAAAEAVEKTVKRIQRRTPVEDNEAELEAKLAALRAGREVGGAARRGGAVGLAGMGVPETEDL